ncbi:hypothetical protein HOK51_09540 [Candidatus Woesearchaeota archaeon]|nr:hypothetical protein [Candidatus Woesearchaeota archaeon]MBT6520065.1 hypothetical protein [Candidatus Woesearchaeota archaeon]
MISLEKSVLREYLMNQDCLIIDGNIFNFSFLVNGRETKSNKSNLSNNSNYLKIGQRKKSLIKGILESELNEKIIDLNKKTILNYINNIMQDKIDEIKYDSVLSENYVLAKFVIEDVIPYMNFKDKGPILQESNKSTNTNKDISLLEETLSRLKDKTKKIFNKNYMLINGCFYKLNSNNTSYDSVDDGIDDNVDELISIIFNNKKYIPCCTDERSECIELNYLNKLERSINQLTNNSTFIKKIKQNYSDNIALAIDQKKHYDESKKVGFEINEKGFFLITWIDSFIVYERKKKKFYQFPDAKIGIPLKTIEGEVVLSPAQIMNKYKHPSLKDINKEYQEICVKGVPLYDLYVFQSDSKRIRAYLSRIRTHFLEDYSSNGQEWQKLYLDNIANNFEDLLINPVHVEYGNISNKESLNSVELNEMKRLLRIR